MTAQAEGLYVARGPTRKPCELCVELGRNVAANHDINYCWLNPNGELFKENLYRVRVALLQEAGKPIPALMQKTQPTA